MAASSPSARVVVSLVPKVTTAEFQRFFEKIAEACAENGKGTPDTRMANVKSL